MRDRRWSRSYPAQGLGLTAEEIEAVLRMYRLPPEAIEADDLSASSAPFERLMLHEHHRLHVWALGVLDAERAVPPAR
jgi:hypothetical protein